MESCLKSKNCKRKNRQYNLRSVVSLPQIQRIARTLIVWNWVYLLYLAKECTVPVFKFEKLHVWRRKYVGNWQCWSRDTRQARKRTELWFSSPNILQFSKSQIAFHQWLQVEKQIGDVLRGFRSQKWDDLRCQFTSTRIQMKEWDVKGKLSEGV